MQRIFAIVILCHEKFYVCVVLCQCHETHWWPPNDSAIYMTVYCCLVCRRCAPVYKSIWPLFSIRSYNEHSFCCKMKKSNNRWFPDFLLFFKKSKQQQCRANVKGKFYFNGAKCCLWGVTWFQWMLFPHLPFIFVMLLRMGQPLQLFMCQRVCLKISNKFAYMHKVFTRLI